MSLPDGKQANIHAQTQVPLASGQSVVVTALPNNQFTISLGQLEAKAVPLLTKLEPSQFPTGAILQVRVAQVEAMPNGNFRAVLNLTSGPLAGQNLSIETSKPLAINSNIMVRVEGSQQLSMLATNLSMSSLAAQQELPAQFNRQGSTAQVLQQLIQMGNSDQIANSGLSKEGQQLVRQLLSNLPDISQKLSPEQLAQLTKNSGTQLEAKLLAQLPDAASQDAKANLLRLIGQLVPQQAGAGSNPLLSSVQAAVLSQALPQLLREIGGVNLGQLREQALRFPVASRIMEKLDNPNDLGALLRIAAAAISRLQTHQLASMAQTYTTAEGTQVTTWQTEIPMRNQDEVVPLQVKFQQEKNNNQEQEQQAPIWRLELNFELEPLGPLHVQVNLQNEQLSSKLWAQQENTAQLVNRELPVLRDKLLAAGLNIKELECRQGIPPAAKKAVIEQRWIDDLA